MIDTTEEIIPLAEVANIIPSQRREKRISYPTLWRWALTGQLETVVIGRGRYTSREAIHRMIERQNAGPESDTPASPAPRRRSARQRARDHAAAEKRLDLAGVK